MPHTMAHTASTPSSARSYAAATSASSSAFNAVKLARSSLNWAMEAMRGPRTVPAWAAGERCGSCWRGPRAAPRENRRKYLLTVRKMVNASLCAAALATASHLCGVCDCATLHNFSLQRLQIHTVCKKRFFRCVDLSNNYNLLLYYIIYVKLNNIRTYLLHKLVTIDDNTVVLYYSIQ